MNPSPPQDLPDLVRRSARTTRITAYVSVFVFAVPMAAIGLGALLDDAPGLGISLLAAAALLVAAVTFTLRLRFGAQGKRWEQRLQHAAGEGTGWREVEVWFVRPSLVENERSQRVALIAEPGGKPYLASKLLVTAGAGLPAGPGRLWSPAGPGRPALLEVGGQHLWPSRPAQGRWGTGMARFAAAVPLSTSTLERPPGRAADPDRR